MGMDKDLLVGCVTGLVGVLGFFGLLFNVLDGAIHENNIKDKALKVAYVKACTHAGNVDACLLGMVKGGEE